MLSNIACNENLSRLGFGCMRLPQTADGQIDRAETQKMVDYAIGHGVNYFDTAWPYHGGVSEIAVGEALRRHPREKWFLATKYPGHQVSDRYDPAEIFEQQLRKCGVEYFDFYLLHNVYENSIGVYTDPKWGILDYFREQKRLGRIRHLGFSCHARPDTLEKWLDFAGDAMEFCQIQLNYLDWKLQDAKRKCEVLAERGIPVWVMEPVRGGRLAKVDGLTESLLKGFRPDASIASWCFRWLQALPEVKVILSGMTTMEQVVDNVSTFEKDEPLSEDERITLEAAADEMMSEIPCTACGYCRAGCPAGLDIPRFMSTLNDIKVSYSINSIMRLDALPEENRPDRCVACGACAEVCPQGIAIPDKMAELADIIKNKPSWADISKLREAEAKAAAAEQRGGTGDHR
jgi:predicted aldo/keto reductase-like oxidoreductase